MMVGDESFNSTSNSRSQHSVNMVRTGVVTAPSVNIDKMAELGKKVTSQPKGTEKIKEEETTAYRSDGIFLKFVKEISSKNHDSAMKNLDNLLEEGSRALISGNFRLALSKHKDISDELLKHPTHVFDEDAKYIWFKYAHFISLIEVNNYSDLINAFNSLQELKIALFAEMPTYHYAVAKLLIKFNRFHLAEEEIQKCREAMVGHDFKKHFWLCTEDVIKETTREGLENYLQELSTICRCYHIPDASCKYEGCISANSHPYPSREIFHSDPDFKGYVVLMCQEGCKVHYHPSCWKNIKETFAKFDKLSDKECLGKPCLTPDCKNSAGEPSVIHKIEIFGSDGNIKSQCVQDLTAEIKQKEIALKKRQRQLSDELKHDKLTAKNKLKTKKGPERSHSSEVLAVPTKIPPPKDSKNLQITGVSNTKPSMPAKEKQSKYREMNNLAAQNEFICSYFMMLVNNFGPLSKEKIEDEWEKFYPIFKPMSGIVTKSCGIYNLLKNSSSFVLVDDLLCIKESPYKVDCSNKDITSVIPKMEQVAADLQPAATHPEPPEPPLQKNPLKQPEPSKISESLKELNTIVQLPSNIDLTATKASDNRNSWAKENAVLDSEIREIEKELQMSSLLDQTSKSNTNSSELLNTKLVDSPGKDRTKVDEMASQHIPHTVNKPFNFLDESNKEKIPSTFNFLVESKKEKIPSTTTIDHQKVTGIPFQKIGESIPMIYPHPEGFFLVPPPVRQPQAPLIPQVPPPLPIPFHMPLEGYQPPKQYGNQDMFKSMMNFPPPMDPCYNFHLQNCKEVSIQTDEKWEDKNINGDETWVQHMQLAVNELMKKNRDLMQSKEELIKAQENEVEALKNQMKTLRQSYEQYIESLKENINRNEDDRRRTLALEQRMKLQEQILNSTKEELRNKDFDLLEAKRLLGITILERVVSESSKQVTRLVTALASLPCNSKEAEAVGKAMSKWESTGDCASKAKSEFMGSCMRHQAKLIDGYGSDTLNELIIPAVEEPAGPCPLDNLTIKLLHDKENSTMNSAKTPNPVPIGIQPFRNRTSIAIPASINPSIVPAPLSPVSLGARPREPTPGEASMRKWPSSHSVQGSTHSSSGGTARALSNFAKLLIELKRCYPSRTEDELCSAIKLTRRKNKNTLSGLSIEKIVGMVGSILDWWPEPIDGAMGLDKFMGWASDVTPAEETFCSISKGPQRAAWMSSSSSPRKDGDKDDCCICLQGMSEPKTDLICSHSFHTQCIRKWLSKESVCPICRKFTRMPDEFPTLK